MSEDLETWENVRAGMVVLMKTQNGVLGHEMVRGGGKVRISEADREMNMEAVYDVANCPFSNGFLKPMHISEEVEVKREKDPNVITDDNLMRIAKSDWRAFDRALSEIDNESILQRLLVMVRDVASARAVEKVEERLGLGDVDPVNEGPLRAGPDPSIGAPAPSPREVLAPGLDS